MEVPQYADDPTITNDAVLWRYIRPEQVVADNNLGCYRPSSACFTDSSDGTAMSVLLANLVAVSNRHASDLLTGKWHDTYLASFTAGFARNLDLGVTTDPPVPEEPAHAWVFGKKTKGVRSRLAKAAQWVIGPPALDKGK
ncbi:MAG: hypothetical protein KAY37_00085 [Phycisphaerae bacterium]|nr:hypothetical protein [Phycisphaerae bacterium]